MRNIQWRRGRDFTPIISASDDLAKLAVFSLSFDSFRHIDTSMTLLVHEYPIPEDPIASGVAQVIIRGIHDLAPLIPLLTTGLCEKHLMRALREGFLNAAATPMTIFGSLGIAKAGFIALCASIDNPLFQGPTLLKNAGFHPTGMGELFLHVKHRKHHLYKAEDKLRTILNKKKVIEVQVNIWSWDFWKWNMRLALATGILCCLGLIPYIILIRVYLKDHAFRSTWVFPLARLFGSGLVSVNIQFLFQLRLMEEAYYRLRFIAADNYLKQTGKSLPTKWDPNERSKNIFSGLQSEWLALKGEALEQSRISASKYRLNEADKAKIMDGAHSLTSFDFSIDADALHSARTPNPSLQDNLQQPAATPQPNPHDTLRPAPNPTTPRSSSGSRQDTVELDAAEQGASDDQHSPSVHAHATSPTTSWDATKTKAITWLSRQFTTLILWGTQAMLLFGILCIVVGYIGCFTIVQRSSHPKWRGPLVWLMCEALLSGVRTAIWATNPTWDDTKLPIVLEKFKGGDRSQEAEASNTGTQQPNRSSSYGVGWALDSPTANDMHALLIGVNNCNTADFTNLEKAKSDAESVSMYLQETLLVPASQIRTLYDTDATRSRIVEELKSLRHRGSVTPDAPIVIYYAGHSFVSEDGSTYLVPHLPNGDRVLEGDPKQYCLSYAEIVDLLRHVADEKTDNIVVILDSCHAGAMAGPPSSAGLTPGRLPRPQSIRTLPPPAEERPGEDLFTGSNLLPSISTIPDDGGETLKTLTGLPLSPEELNEVDSQLLQVGGNPVHGRGQFEMRRPRKVTNATTEILTGHTSHLLIAGADASQQAYEDPRDGGQFTSFLLQVLEEAGESGDLRTMTYKTLVERIQDKFKKIIVGKDRTLLDYQTALCTTIYQDRHLFDGLFMRKVDNRSAKPLIRILYSD